MDLCKKIASTQNPLVKKIALLQNKSRERKNTGLFVLEGWRELQLALKGNYRLETVLFQRDLISGDRLQALLDASTSRTDVVSISRTVYQKLAYRGTTEGIIALVKSKPHTLSGLSLPSENPLLLIAEAPEKPGNIGALLRTADAAGLDAVIIADPKTDLYNPNIVRSSIGCLFTNQIAIGSTAEVITYLKEKNIPCFCASLSASQNYAQTDFKQACAIVVGTEAKGLSQEWLEHSAQNIIIPMGGEIDSMNVSVSAAILIFEAKRQRGFL